VGVKAYRCSVSKSRSLVRSTWPVFIRTWVVARLTPFLKPVFLQSLRRFRGLALGCILPVHDMAAGSE
jgi:hypothetical protein